MPGRSLSPPTPSYGLNNVGLLILTWGRVEGYGGVQIHPGHMADVTWINDGTQLSPQGRVVRVLEPRDYWTDCDQY